MGSYMVRIVLGLLCFVVGIFWASVTLPAIILKALLGGRNGITKFFHRNKHNVLPEIARKNYKHDYVRTKSGIRFHYVHTGSESAPLMLCMHGFPECWYSWRHILEKFSSKYHVVAFDMRGYGDSDKPSSVGQYHMDYLVRDVQEIITGLGYEKAVIVAHDWGGAIAWQLPYFFPEVIDKLIIMNAPHAMGFRKFTTKYPSQFLKSWYIFFFQLPFLAEMTLSAYDYLFVRNAFNGRKMGIKNYANKLNADEIEIYKHSTGRFLHYAINYYRAVNPIYRGMQLSPVTKQIVQPMLLIWGNKDAALDERLVDYSRRYVRKMETCIVEGASHWVAQDEPEQVHEAMEKFLREK